MQVFVNVAESFLTPALSLFYCALDLEYLLILQYIMFDKLDHEEFRKFRQGRN